MHVVDQSLYTMVRCKPKGLEQHNNNFVQACGNILHTVVTTNCCCEYKQVHDMQFQTCVMTILFQVMAMRYNIIIAKSCF